MHLHKLTDLLSFHEVAVGGTLPQTEYYREKLKRLHPMQMLSSNILLPLYEISFSYMTVRGNYRQAKKYAFLAEYSEVDFEAELLLKDWIAEQNARKPFQCTNSGNSKNCVWDTGYPVVKVFHFFLS